jgi:hypothetical protein
MTKKKTPKAPSLKERLEFALKQLADHNDHTDRRIGRLESEANDRIGAGQATNQESTSSTIDGMARARHQEGARRHATPGGPNFPDDIYPPGCGPLQLVWSQNMDSGDVVIGIQGDSFHHFQSKLAAVSWLMGIAQRIINDKPPRK